MAADVGLSSPGGGALYRLDGPADEEERSWRLESGDSGEGLDGDDVDPDRLYPDDGFSWTDSVTVRGGADSPFRWLG